MLTHNEHLHWELRDPSTGIVRPFALRDHESEIFQMGVGKVSRPVKSWEEEFKIAMSKLIDEHGSKFAVFYSGGYDSEILLKELVGLGANVEAHTILFKGHENIDETQRTAGVCEALGVKQVNWIHDVHEYVNEERYMDIGDKYQCTQLAYITVVEHVRKIDLPALMGGEVYVQKHPIPGPLPVRPVDWYYIYREDEDGMTYRYSLDTGHTLINEVFSYTPELLAAWFNSQVVKDVVSGKIPGKMSLLSSKPQIFKEIYSRPLAATQKLHGYENLMMTDAMVQQKMRARLHPLQTQKIQVAELMQWLLS